MTRMIQEVKVGMFYQTQHVYVGESTSESLLITILRTYNKI